MNVITGITGQDGSYLAELLLEKNEKVIGVKRRTSTNSLERISHLVSNPNLEIIEGDITDAGFISGLISENKPDRYFNLAAQSHVGTSFKEPEHTLSTNVLSVTYALESIRRYSPETRFLQASSSEMWGNNFKRDLVTGESYQDLSVPFKPRSPYGVSKLAAHELVYIYRNAYGLFACSSISHNHCSPRRGENFVTRKITKWLGAFKSFCDQFPLSSYTFDKDNVIYFNHKFPKLRLGNIKSFRDWSHAKDIVRAQYMMLNRDSPDDFVLASGKARSVEDFLSQAFHEIGIDDFSPFILIDPKFFREAEVDYLQGKVDRTHNLLNWYPEISFDELVRMMVENDTQEQQKNRPTALSQAS